MGSGEPTLLPEMVQAMTVTVDWAEVDELPLEMGHHWVLTI